ncbi:MAG: glycoside hydrolase family 31 protein [Solirubrobacterales bacterium]|nr:glycoside hydrolase family 31 protein [Solirubrobacterales bacterium]
MSAIGALFGGTASARADEAVASGPLVAQIGTSPWDLELRGFSGAEVLAGDDGLGASSLGKLGFRTALGTYHATNVVSSSRTGQEVRLTVATNDPLGRRIEVNVAPDGDGVLRLAATVGGLPGVSSVTIGFGSEPDERFFGFGERSNAVDQRGNEVENYVSDGPYQALERPAIAAFVPPDGLRFRDDATYFPVPWLLSSRGYGVLIANSEPSRFELGSERADGWSLEADSAMLELRFFAGPEPADALRRLTEQEEVGRQPAPAAPWFFGPWYQPHGKVPELEQAAQLRAADVPASAVNTYLHYLPCGDQRGVEAQQPPRTAGFHERGYAVTTYFNPMLCATYGSAFVPAVEQGLLTKTPLGTPALYRYSASTDDLFLVGQFDFSNPATDTYYGNLLSEAVDDGYDGWMEDFGEYTPLLSVSHNGMTGQQMHNLYPVLYHRSSARFAAGAKRPVAGFIRSGWTGVAPFAQMVWGGDPTVDYGFDGLSSAMTQALSLGASGISRWGSDIGGFFALGRRLTPELLIRWIEFGAVSPIMRTEANGVALPPQPDRPQITDPDVLPVWRRYAKLHTQLYPYLRAADAAYRRTGMPIMRQLALIYPDDAAASGRDDEFMFGPDLLAAPVIRPDARERRLYLPPGRWVDFWGATAYGERRGAFRPTGATLLRGGREISVPAPLDELPLMVRAGAVLPMLTPDVDTLASYGGGDDVVRLDERRDRMVLLAFPRGRSRVGFNEDEHLVSRERRRRWTLRVVGEHRRSYRVRASLGTLRHPFVPREVAVGGRVLRPSKWRYSRDTKVLSFAASLRRGRVLVSGGQARRRGGNARE